MSLLSSPDLLRLILFGGLVLHKVVWELLKIGSGTPVTRRTPQGLIKRLVKMAKLVALLFLVFQTLFLNILPITDQPANLRLLGVAIYFIGLTTAILGRVQLGKNWKDIEDLEAARPESLASNGIYGYIRHPIYTGDMFLLLGLQLALNSWLVFAVIIPILLFAKQALSEEAVLTQRFQDYPSYRRRTKRFIPFIL